MVRAREARPSWHGDSESWPWEGAVDGVSLEGQPSLSWNWNTRQGNRSPAVGCTSEGGGGWLTNRGLPKAAPKPFRPLAEGVNARPCQVPDSAYKLKKGHLCSCWRVFDPITSHLPQYITPAIASLLTCSVPHMQT